MTIRFFWFSTATLVICLLALLMWSFSEEAKYKERCDKLGGQFEQRSYAGNFCWSDDGRNLFKGR